VGKKEDKVGKVLESANLEVNLGFAPYILVS